MANEYLRVRVTRIVRGATHLHFDRWYFRDNAQTVVLPPKNTSPSVHRIRHAPRLVVTSIEAKKHGLAEIAWTVHDCGSAFVAVERHEVYSYQEKEARKNLLERRESVLLGHGWLPCTDADIPGFGTVGLHLLGETRDDSDLESFYDNA